MSSSIWGVGGTGSQGSARLAAVSIRSGSASEGALPGPELGWASANYVTVEELPSFTEAVRISITE
jgi:hypothetical protein